MPATRRHDRRAHALRARIQAAELDALLISAPINVGYMTGFTGSTAYALYAPSDPVLITDTRYAIRAREECPQAEIVIVPSGGYLEGIKSVVDARPALKKVGFESTTLTVAQHTKLVETLDTIELAATADFVEDLRLIKDSGEIAMIEHAIEVAESAFLQVKPLLRPGISEAAFALELDYAMRKAGAQGSAFETIVASGPNSARPHHTPGDRVLEVGDLVIVDWGAAVDGYNSDMTRTFALGSPEDLPAEAKRIYDVVLEAQRLAIAAILPGKIAKDIDAIARDYIAGQGYGANFGHSLGHSLGRDVHDGPGFSIRSDKLPVAPGMVQTVEPGVYVEDLGGVRIEHDIVVTEDGCRILTHLPTGLDFLG